MNDRVIDAIREVDPCPDELSGPPIELVWRRLRDEPDRAKPAASRWRPSVATLAVAVSSGVAIAVGVFAIMVLGHAHLAGQAASPAGDGAGPTVCRSQLLDGVLPAWARAGFSQPRPQMPYALGESGRIAAILWGSLDSPPSADHSNKILWVSRVPTRPGRNFTIRAQQLVAAKPLGAPIIRTVSGGPGPSIINLPAPGCWRLTLRWSGWTDHVDLQYGRSG
jgi:hypothetical protein